jgi:iron(III) transport system ATP-binding protein
MGRSKMITANSLKKRFTTDKGQIVDALNDVSFEVTEGEFYVLLGPSGSGKTTTLRAVAGLETPDTGFMQIGDQAVFSSDQSLNIAPEERPVSMVFQSYALWPHMNVQQNIEFPLRHGVRRVDAAEIARRVASVTNTLELTPYLKRPISQLSGGQQQRVALGRAMALEPSVLLMDEPLSNLDAKLRAQLRIEIKNLTKSLGITTLYVTHDQVEAMVMGDRIAVMNRGAIVEQGTPSELYKHPRSEFVANFLGDMNFFPCSLTPDTSSTTTVDSAIGKFAVATQPDRPTVGAARIGVRPEDIHLGKVDQSVQFSARVLQCYYLGEAFSCDLAIGEQKFAARLPNTSKITAGEEAAFSINPCDFTVFSAATH